MFLYCADPLLINLRSILQDNERAQYMRVLHKSLPSCPNEASTNKVRNVILTIRLNKWKAHIFAIALLIKVVPTSQINQLRTRKCKGIINIISLD